MNNNNFFANGRVAVLSSKLLSTDKFNKLIECGNLSEATRTMSEFGYGDASLETANDYELALHRELAQAVSTFVELSTDEFVTSYYMARYDYHNAKTLAKCKYNRIDGIAFCYEFGSIAPVKLADMINADNYNELPVHMAEALSAIDNLHFDNADNPRIVDLIIDKAMFAHMCHCAQSAKYTAMKNIVCCEIDTTNIITMFRARGISMPQNQYEEMIIDGGSMDRQWFVDNYSVDNELIVDRLYGSTYRVLAVECIENTIADAERMATNMRRSLLVGTDVSTLAPVLSYYNSKIIEIDKIRYIMMCIKSGMDREATKDRLKELYG